MRKFSLRQIRRLVIIGFLLGCACVVSVPASAQDRIPRDNGIYDYHPAPHYRESESHPLRIAAYIFHPIGWLAREVIFRPLSYFASSSETRRSVMGYREPFDYRQPECYSADHSSPDCRSLLPYNYDAGTPAAAEVVMEAQAEPVRQVYFPDVNYDFDKGNLNDLGKGRAYQIAQLLKNEQALHVVLEGHTDSVGTEQYNEQLGTRRAEALRAELMALGVSGERLSTVTFGKSQPLLDQDTDWARAVNRRVEVHVDDSGMAIE